MLSFLWDLASFIVALGVLITVHEFGHFWVARRCGVRVERFSHWFRQSALASQGQARYGIRYCRHSAWWLRQNAG